MTNYYLKSEAAFNDVLFNLNNTDEQLEQYKLERACFCYYQSIIFLLKATLNKLNCNNPINSIREGIIQCETQNYSFTQQSRLLDYCRIINDWRYAIDKGVTLKRNIFEILIELYQSMLEDFNKLESLDNLDIFG